MADEHTGNFITATKLQDKDDEYKKVVYRGAVLRRKHHDPSTATTKHREDLYQYTNSEEAKLI